MRRLLPMLAVVLAVTVLPVATTLADCGDLDDGSGGIATGYGAWGPWPTVQEPPLTVTDAPVVTRDEDLYRYRCSEDTPGTYRIRLEAAGDVTTRSVVLVR